MVDNVYTREYFTIKLFNAVRENKTVNEINEVISEIQKTIPQDELRNIVHSFKGYCVRTQIFTKKASDAISKLGFEDIALSFKWSKLVYGDNTIDTCRTVLDEILASDIVADIDVIYCLTNTFVSHQDWSSLSTLQGYLESRGNKG